MRWWRGALIVGVLAATAVGTWWLLSEDDATVSTSPGAPPVDPSAPTAFVRDDAPEDEAVDAGVGRVTGRVVREDGAPVVGAEVLVYAAPAPVDGLQCGICHADVLNCADPATVQQVLEGLRDGHLRRGQPALRVLTGASGEFSFEEAPLRRELLVIAPEGSAVGETQPEFMELVLQAPVPEEAEELLSVVDVEDKPIAGARVTVYSALTGAVVEFVTDQQGQVRLPHLPFDPWFAVEAPGCLPVGGHGRSFVIAPPMALTLRTTMGGKPVDADITTELHRPAGALRTRNGVLRLEGLVPGVYAFKATSGELTSAEVSQELTGREAELTLELMAGAKLFVTVVTETGEPIDAVVGDLTGLVHPVGLGAQAEKGAPLVLGLVPEGEYRLTISADGFVSTTRQLDLKPGENALEVTLRAATLAKGRVVDGKGVPVPMARVEVLDGEYEVAGAYTDEDGTFSVPLDESGSFRVLAERPMLGSGEQAMVLPGAAVTVVLAPGAAIEAEVFDVDGTAANADIVLLGDQSVLGVLEEVPDSHVRRRAGLKPGQYVLSVTQPDRVPQKKVVSLRADEVLRVTLRLDEGATVKGRVVNAAGVAIGNANIFAMDVEGVAGSDEKGHFEFKGLPPGPVELYGYTMEGRPLAELKLTAPAQDVVLVAKAGTPVKGRVIDERGAPLASVRVGDVGSTGADGRFEVEILEDTAVEFFREGYSSASVEKPAADVGDVVLRRLPVIEGEVVDAEGRPVSGASVRTPDAMEYASSDAAGHFTLRSLSEAAEVTASRGGLFGKATVKPGAITRVVLAPGTQVFGRVLGPSGGVATTVSVSSLSGLLSPEPVDTDSSGRFELVLPEGVWSFSARSDRSARNIEVRGARMEVLLGESPTDCGLQVSAPEPIVAFSLLPAGSAEQEGVAGGIDFPGRRQELTLTARAVPCGEYLAVALLRTGLVRQPVSLRGKGQALRLDLAYLQTDEPAIERMEPIPMQVPVPP